MKRFNRPDSVIGSKRTLSCALAALLVMMLSTTAIAEDAPEPSCDCSCERYSLLVAETLPQSPLPEDELLSCAGACAMAWVRCEEQQALVETQTESDSESSDDTLGAAVAAQAPASTELQ